ncbi:MAG: serine/threonine protein kinase [Candidatus Obscuribacterales bacterium]|nr:serine/threonine protein kinase [Candidatus Obscuribacterales bacterium]
MDEKIEIDITLAGKQDSISSELTFPSRYKVKSMIGQGGMGKIFLAEDIQLMRDVAIKVMLFEGSTQSDLQQRFLREAKSLATLKHPNVVEILSSAITETGEPFHVMEFIEGHSLADELKKTQKLTIARLCEIFIQVLDGLSHIHEHNIIHRDLKPSNIMLCKDIDGNLQAKIIDFGIAKFETGEGSETLTGTNALPGSPNYMSPEQCKGGKIDKASDIYSIACIMHECLTGKPPFQGATPVETMYKQMSEAPPTIPIYHKSKATTKLVKTIEACLNKDPKLRVMTAADVQFTLQSIIRESSNDKDFASTLPTEKRKDRAWTLVTILFIVLVGAITIGLIQSNKKTASPPMTTSKTSLQKLTKIADDYSSTKSKKASAERTNAEAELLAQLQTLLRSEKLSKKSQNFAAYQLLFTLQTDTNAPAEDRISSEEKALEYCGDADILYKRECWIRLANCYLLKKDYRRAKDYSLKVLADHQASNEEAMVLSSTLWKHEGSACKTQALASLAGSECFLGEFEESKKNYKLLEQAELAEGHIAETISILLAKARAFWEMKQYGEARETVDSLVTTIRNLDKDNFRHFNDFADCMEIVKWELKIGNKDKAKEYAKAGRELCERIGRPLSKEDIDEYNRSVE